MRKLDSAIERKQANILRLRAELAQEEADLKSMLRTRELVSEGEAPPPVPARMSIPDAVESVLRVAGEAHVDDLLARLNEMGLTTNKQSLTSALTRYHNRQKRFVRTGKNRYALRDGGQVGGED
jgi:hypothetical protein